MKIKTLLVLVLTMCSVLSSTNCFSAGSSVANKNVKVFRELIIEGERPEISSCLTMAIQSVKSSPAYDKINWEPEMSAQAVVHEYQVSGAFIKEITLKAFALIRDERILHLDNWAKVEIHCQQINEGKPSIYFRKDL